MTGLLIRAGGYALVGVIATHYDCGQAMLTGLLAGDMLGSVVGLIVPGHCRSHLQTLAELALLTLVVLWVHKDLAWPADQSLRAIAGLAGLGVFAGHVGGGAMTRITRD